MVLKFKSTEVIVEEFSHSFVDVDGMIIEEVDALLDIDIENVEKIYSSSFILMDFNEEEMFIYEVLENFKLNEYFEENGFVRIICIKEK